MNFKSYQSSDSNSSVTPGAISSIEILIRKLSLLSGEAVEKNQSWIVHQKQNSPIFPKKDVVYRHNSIIKLKNPDNDRLCFSIGALVWPLENCRFGINWKINIFVICIRIQLVRLFQEMAFFLAHPDSRTHVWPYLLVPSHLSTLQLKTVHCKLWFEWIVFYSDGCIRFSIVGSLKILPLGWVHLEAQTTILRRFIVLFPSTKISVECSKHVEKYFIQKVRIINTLVLYTCWYQGAINFHLILLYISKYFAGAVSIAHFQSNDDFHQKLSLL